MAAPPRPGIRSGGTKPAKLGRTLKSKHSAANWRVFDPASGVAYRRVSTRTVPALSSVARLCAAKERSDTDYLIVGRRFGVEVLPTFFAVLRRATPGRPT